MCIALQVLLLSLLPRVQHSQRLTTESHRPLVRQIEATAEEVQIYATLRISALRIFPAVTAHRWDQSYSWVTAGSTVNCEGVR